MDDSIQRYSKFVLLLIALVATSCSLSMESNDFQILPEETAESQFVKSHSRNSQLQKLKLQRRPKSSSVLDDVIEGVVRLHQLTPSVGPSAKNGGEPLATSNNAGKKSHQLDEVLRYLNARARSKLLHLLETPEHDSKRSKWKTPEEESSIRSDFKQRLMDQVVSQQQQTMVKTKSHYSDGLDNELTKVHNSRQLSDGNALFNDKNDTERWEDCQLDYSSFVEPITNSLWNAIRAAVCEALGLDPNGIVCNLIEQLPQKDRPEGARRMIDAMSKIPTGIGNGKLAWVGAYDLCERNSVSYTINITQPSGDVEESLRAFDGRYCRLDIYVDPQLPLPLQFGVCVPNTCSSEHVLKYINESNRLLNVFLRLLQWNVSLAYCGHDVDGSSDASFIVAKTILITSLVIVVLATIYDGFFRQFIYRRDIKKMEDDIAEIRKKSGQSITEREIRKLTRVGLIHRLELIFVAFSAYSNLRRIFTMRTKPRHLHSLDGIRCLSYGYIIWGQSYVWGPLYTEAFLTDNLLLAARTLPQELRFQHIINFHRAADSFLLISGILVTFGFLKKSDKMRGFFSVIKSSASFLVLRYWRLMPALMLSIMAIATTYKYTADGPFYPLVDVDSENCKVNWWVNLLMLNNLVKVSEQCFGHAWFVSLAFQLYIASLVVVIPLLLRPMLGYISLVALYIVHIIVTAILTSTYRHDGELEAWYNGYFITPWCRAGPFIIGLAFGILLYHKPSLKLRPSLIALFWLLSIGTIATLPALSYDQLREGGEPWSAAGRAAYDTISRSLWGLAVAWIAVACQWGYAGVVNDLLSWTFFLPMSRLVYIAMVWHAPVMFAYVYSLRQALYIDPFVMFYASLTHITLVLLVGILMALLWDYPLAIRWPKVVLCRSWFDWMRCGRHPQTLINRLEKDVVRFQADAVNKR